MLVTTNHPKADQLFPQILFALGIDTSDTISAAIVDKTSPAIGFASVESVDCTWSAYDFEDINDQALLTSFKGLRVRITPDPGDFKRSPVVVNWDHVTHHANTADIPSRF